MAYGKVGFIPRFIAALIDGIIGWIVVFIPFIGGILGFLYLLLKDGIMYEVTKNEEWRNKSIGKKVMNLEVMRLDGGRVDLAVSARRNIPLTIGSIIAIIPLLGWVIGPIVSLIFAVIELFMFLTDEHGRRLGDRWANTQVIEVKNVSVSDDTTM